MKRRVEDDQPGLFQMTGGAETALVAGGKASAAPWVPEHATLTTLREAMPACRGCELYRDATQVVPGAGRAHAPLVLVGEQPGDQEDVQGLPFVGPAGRVLHRAMELVGVDPAAVYVTNAVKHFKFVQRGKLRLHQTPRMSEITACRPWLLAELGVLRPRVVLCLGATAAKSLLGSGFSVTQSRGRFVSAPFADKVMATYHPSAILRAQDAQAGEDMMHLFQLDLRLAYEAAVAATA